MSKIPVYQNVEIAEDALGQQAARLNSHWSQLGTTESNVPDGVDVRHRSGLVIILANHSASSAPMVYKNNDNNNSTFKD